VQSDDTTLAVGRVTALVAAGFGQGADPLATLRAGWSDPSSRARVLALRGLHRQGALDDDTWNAALADPANEVRREALVVFAASDPNERRTTAIVTALSDSDPLVVDAALFVVGEHLLHEALAGCVRLATEHEDARVREAAVAALGALGDDEGLAPILAAFDDKPPVRRRAVVALANFDGPLVDEALARARDDRDWQVRAAADALSA